MTVPWAQFVQFPEGVGTLCSFHCVSRYLSISCFIPKIFAFKVALKLLSKTDGSWAPDFLDLLDFEPAISDNTHFQT